MPRVSRDERVAVTIIAFTLERVREMKLDQGAVPIRVATVLGTALALWLKKYWSLVQLGKFKPNIRA